MNTDQFLSLIRTLLKIGAGSLVAHGYASSSTAELLIAAALAVVSVLWSHVTHQETGNASQPTLPGLKLMLFCFLALPLLGCTSMRQIVTEEKPDGTKKRSESYAHTFFDGK